MITWIQRTFQRHTKLVFLFLLIVITIPFIFTIGAAPGIGRSGNKLLERSFFGVNLGNEEQARRVFTDGNLSANLGPVFANFAAREGAQRYALERVAGLALADELHLPAPTADQISRFVTTLRAFQNEQGQFDQKRYTGFGDSLKLGGQLTPAMVNRVLRDDTRLEQLGQIVGGPGYVMPGDIKQQLINTDSSWTVQVATLDYASFNPAIAPTDETLKKFFDENSFRYEVPVRPRFSMVEFKGAAFMPPVEPTEAEARAYYNSNPAAFPVPADADKKDPVPAVTPAAGAADSFSKVRAQVVAAMKQAASGRLASKAANDLTVALFERKLAANSPELTAFLASTGLPVTAIPSFDPNNPPPDKPWLANYAEAIARLSKDRFFSDPLPTTDSFVVLLWNETMPAYKPLFTEARDRVAADFKDQEKRRLFIEHGRAVRAVLQAAAKTPAGFAAAAATEKLDVKSYANFTFRQPPPDLPAPALQGLQRLEAGQVSEMSASADKGYVVYVQEKKLPELGAGNPRYAEMQKQLKLFTAGYNEHSYLGELVDRELKKTETTKMP
jgi:peptidyl-prolyl cis-trans isomerase D